MITTFTIPLNTCTHETTFMLFCYDYFCTNSVLPVPDGRQKARARLLRAVASADGARRAGRRSYASPVYKRSLLWNLGA